MRGEFIRGDGLVIPNNISKAGAAVILAAALRNDVPTLFAALVTGVPSPNMTFATMVEPTIGTNGYGRISIPRTNVGWPTLGNVGDETFCESQTFTFTAAGGNFNQAVQRVALVGSNAYNVNDPVYALSAALPAPLTIGPATLLAERQFKYRIYL